jgi:hypothetical protein
MRPRKQNSSVSSTAASASSRAVKTPCSTVCEIPSFRRSYFYTGKLLTESDLTREQRYTIDKLRLHYTALHGWGVVCGLMVRPHPQCADRFVVTAGFAVDDCGREIRLLKDCVVKFPTPPQPVPDPCEPQPDSCDEKTGSSAVEPEDQTYYVCIRYNECQEDFMPVLFSDCCGTPNQPNVVSECAAIDLLTEPPGNLQEIEHRKHLSHDEHCRTLLEHIPEECRPIGSGGCIPLAVIRRYVYDDLLTDEMIENAIRPLAPSVPRIESLVRCILEHLPEQRTTHLTHISRIHWEHDREYRPHEFLNEFVGTLEAPKGFVIEFDGQVHHHGLNNRTFQAMIVRHPPQSNEPLRPEIAPARVTRSDDGRHCTLHMEIEYARHHLQDQNFDVIITLQCDKVIDERGVPVDGNLLAELREGEEEYMVRYPTGNGIPGGLFESWIRVRR